VITPQVEELRTRFDLPGMKILQFAFDGSPDNPYLPRRHGELSVVYTGTHDNDTTVGWWEELDEPARERVSSFLVDPDEEMPWALVRLAMESPARLAVVPAQDLLGLGSESRMNTPGTARDNWAWQAAPDSFDTGLASRLRDLVASADRLR
jgi:4-alpha-glucanotransferase